MAALLGDTQFKTTIVIPMLRSTKHMGHSHSVVLYVSEEVGIIYILCMRKCTKIEGVIIRQDLKRGYAGTAPQALGSGDSQGQRGSVVSEERGE